MPRKPSQVQQVRPASSAPLPPEAVLQAVAALLRPAIELLLHSGIDYPRLAAELKPLFIEQALAALAQAGRPGTDSAISLLSGVHRKDVRAWRLTGQPAAAAKPVAASARVIARWLSDAEYRTDAGAPRALPRTGPAPSFESLVRAVTQDVHPFTVLQELIRLGSASVEIEGERELVVPTRTDFTALPGSREALELLAASLADHTAAAVANVLGADPTLEQSVFAAGITAESAKELQKLARRLWARARTEIIEEATRLYAADQDRPDARMRVRFGSYFWSAPWEPAAPPPEGTTEEPES